MFNDISPESYTSPLANISPATIDKQQKDRQRERDETLSQLPLLKIVIKRLDKRIAETDSNKITRLLAKRYELEGNEAMALQEIVHDILITERRFIETRISRAKP